MALRNKINQTLYAHTIIVNTLVVGFVLLKGSVTGTSPELPFRFLVSVSDFWSVTMCAAFAP